MTQKNAMDALKSARETLANASRTLQHIDVRNDVTKKIEEESPNNLLQKVKDIALAARRVNKVYDAAADLYGKIKPYVGPVLKPIGWMAGKLKDAFLWSAFERENGKMKLDEDGDPKFSPGRLARVFAMSTMMGLAGVAGLQTAYFHATQFEQTIYVTGGKQELIPGELYQFTGCSSLPCSTAAGNGEYYRIAHSLYSPRLLYPENDVFAIIPTQDAACTIKGYGLYIRGLRAIFRMADMYHNVYDVTCRPLNPHEIQQASEPSIAPPVVTAPR